MTAEVFLWGRTIGAVTFDSELNHAVFEYAPEFIGSGIEVSPIAMPLRSGVFSFPELPKRTFHGLPGLLADSLPDMFGNAVINAWLATQGRAADSINPVERLCYTGTRGMGALEYAPILGPLSKETTPLQIDLLAQLADDVLRQREDFQGHMLSDDKQKSLIDLLRIGSSAGGARAKAVIAWNRETGQIRSGQAPVSTEYEHWLIKFDGVTDAVLTSSGYAPSHGALEYAYHLMATAAGIEMSECRLHESNGLRHFMTRRFDRSGDGQKVHMQSLGALGHFDFNQPGSTCYEQAFLLMRGLGLDASTIEQQFRRMVFNVIARNQDDHVKNIALLMDRTGRWTLSPAYDLTYSYNPDGVWTSRHQMSINGKRDAFTLSDIEACAQTALMKRGRATAIVDDVQAAVHRWPEFSASAQVPESTAAEIRTTHRKLL